jgi:molybdopterin biosynthesis enzyme MoaB
VKPIRIAVVTISDGVARGERTDPSGRAIAEWAIAKDHDVVAQILLPDDSNDIADAIKRIADDNQADVILTTVGTGLTVRDVTP